MPPEPLSWDRRDFRKQDRSAADPRFAGGSAPNRWREQPTAPPPFQQQRWFPDFRSPRLQFPAESHGRQSSWHAYTNDGGQGFVPMGPRYADRNLEDENNRPFEPRGDGRYNRENRNPFTRRQWKAPTWSPSVPAKPIAEVSNLMSVQNSSSRVNSFASPVALNSVNLSEQSLPLMKEKEKNNKNGGAVDETTGLESGKENCLESVDGKPLKLTQVDDLPSSTSKTVEVGPTNILDELKPKNTTVVQSLAEDACVQSSSPVLSEETLSGRKRRLGWGEGLAKYEKKRVEGPEDGMHKNELFVSVSNTETLPSESVGPPEKSPRVGGVSDCASPSTPSSVVCSSSPVIEEKGPAKEADVDLDTTNSSCSPSIAPKIHYDGPTFNLQNLELASIANLSLMIDDLLQTDDPTSAERTASMSKLLVWKVDMLKALEMTESEIESLETELKSLIAEPKNFCPVGSSSLPIEEQLKPCEDAVTASKCGIKFVPLQINLSGEMIAESAPVGPEDVHVLLNYEDIDSPGSATSRFVETAEVTEGSMNLNVDNSGNLDGKCLKNGLSHEENSGYVENRALTETTVEDLAGVSNMHCCVGNVYDSILSSNRDAARKSTEQLNKLLPKHLHFKSSISLQSDPAVVKVKFLMRKQSLRFKEKVLTIKFKAFRHFWKEGRLVSTRKLRGKTHKKFDPSRNGQKRNHSSHARGPHTVPADEVINLVNGLLSKSAFKPHGSTLMMPALILDKEVKMSRFISTNGLVEDPCSVEKKRSMLNPWTSEEKEVFIDKLAVFGKDFGKIASFLDRRSVADCIEFYYKNHKSKCFEKIKKNPASLNQIKSPSKTYLVASGKRRNPELNASSLDILGAASEIVANIDNGIKLPSIFSYGASSSREAGDDLLQGPDNDEREAEAADVLASICGSLSSEGVSSCITSSVDKPGDGPRIESSTKQPSTPDVTQDVDDEMSDSSCGEMDPTDWSDEEKSIFVQAVSIYGKNFEMVSQRVGTRSADECKLFFSKARRCLELDQVQPGGRTPLVDDHGGDSDIEDGCTVETGSVICNNDSDFSIEETLPPLDMKLNHQSDVAGPDFEISKGSNGSVPKDLSQSVIVSSHMESGKGIKEEDELCMLDGLNEAENMAPVEVSDQQPEGNSDNKIVKVKDANSGEVSDISKAKSELKPLPNVSWPCTSDSIAASQILWGYPVSGQTMKERIGDVKCKESIALPDVTEQNRKLSSDRFFVEKCNGKVVEAPFPSLGRSRDHSRPQPSCSSGEGPSRNGDVKLFGTILNSSQQKTNNIEQRTDGNKRRDHKIGHESLNLNLGAHQTANLDSVQSKVGPEHIPVGYWDGNRIRTGVPPLPDSALLLAKYPTAFTNYTKLSQPPSAFLPHREASSSKGPADFRYPELQPFTIGMNQRQDDVLHRRNSSSFDLGSGMPNVNVNVVRRAGGFAGGQGLSLSDPVRAMKMQYEAKIEELRMKGGNLIKEVDRWINSSRR